MYVGSEDLCIIGYPILAVYNHWTGLVDWTTGLILKLNFTTLQSTLGPVGVTMLYSIYVVRI